MSPNVILITIDCLRADHVGSLGYARPTTPHIDAIARRGTIFTQALSNGPKTSASFPSILTSTYPLMYGGTAYLAEDRTSIAEVLKNHGYSTVAFHSNPFLSSSYGYNKGFDTFWDAIQETPQLSRLARRIRSRLSPRSLPYRILRRMHRFFDLWNVTSTFAPAEVINRETIHWLESASNRFFLVVALHGCSLSLHTAKGISREISPSSSIRESDG